MNSLRHDIPLEQCSKSLYNSRFIGISLDYYNLEYIKASIIPQLIINQ